MANKAIKLIKNEAVLLISFILAVISSFFVPPSAEYIDYIDFRTLALLLCLMLVTAGLNRQGIFNLLSERALSKAGNIRTLSMLLCLMCFFSSMIITNDVALITFVPFTVVVLKMADRMKDLIKLVVFETVAANLGSMATPIGNPQNLYLFSAFEMDMASFLITLLPYVLLSLLLIIICTLCFDKSPVMSDGMTKAVQPQKAKVALYIILFLPSLLTVFRVLDFLPVLLITVVSVLIFDRKTLLKADFSLLLTFVFLFIFIGNLGRIEAVSNILGSLVSGNEVLVGIAASQVFSNVPAAILLSGFTDNAENLLIGVNLGGLGTLIASMASLISFKFIAKEDVSKSKYIVVFTIVNIVFLAFNFALWMIIK